MDLGVTIVGALTILMGVWVIIRKDSFAQRQARWDDRLYGKSRPLSEYRNVIPVGGCLLMAVGVVFVIVGLT